MTHPRHTNEESETPTGFALDSLAPSQENLEAIAIRIWRAYTEYERGQLTPDWDVLAKKHRDAHLKNMAELAQGNPDNLLPSLEARERKNAEAAAKAAAKAQAKAAAAQSAQPAAPEAGVEVPPIEDAPRGIAATISGQWQAKFPDLDAATLAQFVGENGATLRTQLQAEWSKELHAAGLGAVVEAPRPIDFLQTVFFDGGVTEGDIRFNIANISFERRDRAEIAQEIADGPEGDVRVSMQTRSARLQDWEQSAVAMKVPHPSGMPAPSMTLRHGGTGDAYAIWLLLDTVDLRKRKLPKELTGDAPLPGYGGWSIEEAHPDRAYKIEALERAIAPEAPAEEAPEVSSRRMTPAERCRLAAEIVRAKTARPSEWQMTVRDHNRRTLETALQCADYGLPIVVVNSFDEKGPREPTAEGGDGGSGCTCEWSKRKRNKEIGEAFVACPPKSAGKHPVGAAWQKTATTDRKQIIARWSDKFTRLNVGIVYGAEDGNGGYVLVDADGDDGRASFEKMEKAGELPKTVTLKTGSGGFHRIYRVPPGWSIRNTQKAIALGVDIRGKNGFSVTAGSLHFSGDYYGWAEELSLDDVPIADMPIALLRKCFFATKGNRGVPAPDGSTFEQAGLDPELLAKSDAASADQEENAPPRGAKKSTHDVNPFADAAKQAGRVWDDCSYEEFGTKFGDGPGLRGFHGPMYQAGCKYFARFGYEADAAPLKANLIEWIEAAPLASDDPANYRDGYLTDAVLDQEIENARKWALALPNAEAKKAKGPLDPWPRGYCESGGYLCYLRSKTMEGQTGMEPVPMTVLFEVVGRTLDETRESAFGTLIHFKDEHGKPREAVILDSDARSDTGGVIARLSDVGFWIDNTNEAKSKFLTLLGRLKGSSVVTVASRAGWHDGTFVTPYGQAIGADQNMRLAEKRRFLGEPTSGSLDAWMAVAANVMALRDFHGSVILSSGFAGVLVDLLKRDTCGLAFTRKSSVGKSKTQMFASTIWCNPHGKKNKLFVKLRATDNGVEPHAANASGTTLQLDEMKELAPPARGQVILMLPNNESKARQDGEQGLQDALLWWTYFVVSSEETIRELIEQCRDATFVTGQAVRCVDISVANAVELDDAGAAFVEEGMTANWGWAGPRFVQHLIDAGYVDHPERLAERLQEATAWLLDGQPGTSAKSRAAGVLALALVAGEIAQEAGALPREWEGSGPPRDDSYLGWAFRKAWERSWGDDDATPENSPEAAWGRIKGKVQAIWHLHSSETKAEDDGGTSDDLPQVKLAKWFYASDKFVMKDTGTRYVAVSRIAFSGLAEKQGVAESAVLEWLADQGKLIRRPNGTRTDKAGKVVAKVSNYWTKLPDEPDADHYRFLATEIGPGATVAGGEE